MKITGVHLRFWVENTRKTHLPLLGWFSRPPWVSNMKSLADGTPYPNVGLFSAEHLIPPPRSVFSGLRP